MRSHDDELLRHLAEESATTEGDLARLRAAFPADLSTVARGEDAPAGHASPRGRRRAAVLGLAATGLLAASAALLLRPPPAELDSNLAIVLDSPDLTSSLGIGQAIEVDYRGSGQVQGRVDDAVIDWEQGRIDLEVDPERHVEVVVRTREAEARVKGTVFAVDRSPLGTTLTVERGLVGFTCDGGESRDVGAGESASCQPTSPGGLLGRARALQDQGAAPVQVRDAVERGLAAATPGSPLHGELRALRIQLLVAEGEAELAMDDVRAYLAEGNPLRGEEVAQVGLRLALAGGRCAEAVDMLQHLGGQATPEERGAVDACREAGPE